MFSTFSYSINKLLRIFLIEYYVVIVLSTISYVKRFDWCILPALDVGHPPSLLKNASTFCYPNRLIDDHYTIIYEYYLNIRCIL